MMATSQKLSGGVPRLSLTIPRLLLLILLSCRLSLCAAPKDPGGRPAGVYLATWKLCLLVALLVVAAVALLVALIVWAWRRRNKNAAVLAAGGDGDDKVYIRNPWPTGLRSSRPPDNPRSINPTMVRSPFSPPTSSESPPTIPDSVPPFGEWDSPSRTSNRPPGLPCAPPAAGRPERVRPKRRKEQAVIIKDPLARYSPAKSVPLTLLVYERLESAADGLLRKSLMGGHVGPSWQVVLEDKQYVGDNGLPATVVIKSHRNTFREKDCDRIREELKCKFTLRHKNIVSLLGYSLGKGRLYLVYEHMSNGSLENHLFPAPGTSVTGLNWLARYRIATEVAQGLDPLHASGQPHGSISVSSIMLDNDYIAHIDDHFYYRPTMNTTAETNVSYSLEADIADLGAVILELVCGRRRTAALSFFGSETMPLVDWLWAHYGEAFKEPDGVRDEISQAVQREVNKNRLFSAVDPTLDAEINKPQASKLLTLGLACSHPDPKLRPKIRQVREVLLEMKPAPQVPLSKPTM